MATNPAQFATRRKAVFAVSAPSASKRLPVSRRLHHRAGVARNPSLSIYPH